MKTKIIALALAATVMAGGTAIAQDAPPAPPPPPPGLFLHADANKDGVVTRAELTADIDGRFAKVDTNKDGKIDPNERFAARKAMRDAGPQGPGHRGGRMMRGGGMHADKDGDGIVTLEDVRAPALKLFAYVDRNNDGKIDKAEAEQFRDAAMAARGPGGPGKHGRHRGHGGPHGRHGPPLPPAGAPAT